MHIKAKRHGSNKISMHNTIYNIYLKINKNKYIKSMMFVCLVTTYIDIHVICKECNSKLKCNIEYDLNVITDIEVHFSVR